MDNEMANLAMADLNATDAVLYKAAKAFVMITEAWFLQEASALDAGDPAFLRIGNAVEELEDAVSRHSAALGRWRAIEEKTGEGQ